MWTEVSINNLLEYCLSCSYIMSKIQLQYLVFSNRNFVNFNQLGLNSGKMSCNKYICNQRIDACYQILLILFLLWAAEQIHSVQLITEGVTARAQENQKLQELMLGHRVNSNEHKSVPTPCCSKVALSYFLSYAPMINKGKGLFFWSILVFICYWKEKAELMHINKRN